MTKLIEMEEEKTRLENLPSNPVTQRKIANIDYRIKLRNARIKLLLTFWPGNERLFARKHGKWIEDRIKSAQQEAKRK